MTHYGDRMPEVPPEVTIRATIQPGSVYYFHHEDIVYSNEPHYFVVINIDPSTEQVIFLVCASSRIDKVKERRNNLPPETLVTVSPDEYLEFKYPSIFDCNTVYLDNIEHLIQRLVKKQLELKLEMNIQLVEQLRQGVIASPLIQPLIKNQLITQ